MVNLRVREQRIEIEVHTSAGADRVYALLRDGASWPVWSPIESFELERSGAGEPEGIGAIRIFRRGRTTGRDQITELVPGRRFGYRNVAGIPVRDYRGEIDLEPDEGGTGIRWCVTFLPRWPGTGWLLRLGLRRLIGQAAHGLAAHASRTA